MKKAAAWLILICIPALNAGCATRGAVVYLPQVRRSVPEKLHYRVAVRGFNDLRGNKNKDYSLMMYIPLYPWGTAKYDRPEAGSYFIDQVSYLIRPSEDFARALIADLRAADMFEEAFYTEREVPPDVDLIVEGDIISTNYEGKTISYCVSAAAEYLWLLGLPKGVSSNEIKLRLRLVDAGTGKILWRKSYSHETSHLGGLYYKLHEYCAGYPKMIGEINLDAVRSIYGVLSNDPPHPVRK